LCRKAAPGFKISYPLWEKRLNGMQTTYSTSDDMINTCTSWCDEDVLNLRLLNTKIVRKGLRKKSQFNDFQLYLTNPIFNLFVLLSFSPHSTYLGCFHLHFLEYLNL